VKGCCSDDGLTKVEQLAGALTRIAESQGLDPELYSYMVQKAMYSTRSSRRAAELRNKGSAWLDAERGHWSTMQKTAQLAHVVPQVLKMTPAEDALFTELRRGQLWFDSPTNQVWQMDAFARQGTFPRYVTRPSTWFRRGIPAH